jgi:hypothetical protein
MRSDSEQCFGVVQNRGVNMSKKQSVRALRKLAKEYAAAKARLEKALSEHYGCKASVD